MYPAAPLELRNLCVGSLSRTVGRKECGNYNSVTLNHMQLKLERKIIINVSDCQAQCNSQSIKAYFSTRAVYFYNFLLAF